MELLLFFFFLHEEIRVIRDASESQNKVNYNECISCISFVRRSFERPKHLPSSTFPRPAEPGLRHADTFLLSSKTCKNMLNIFLSPARIRNKKKIVPKYSLIQKRLHRKFQEYTLKCNMKNLLQWLEIEEFFEEIALLPDIKLLISDRFILL